MNVGNDGIEGPVFIIFCPLRENSVTVIQGGFIHIFQQDIMGGYPEQVPGAVYRSSGSRS